MRKGPRKAQRATRREALKVGAAALFPLILPSGARAQPGHFGANDRVVTGHIGAGVRGQSLLATVERDVAAVCDVYDPNLRRGASIAGAGVRIYPDYRQLLDQHDIDAVVIASPDHWHTLHAVHAIEAGKDVWLDIPLTRHIGELPLLQATADQYGCVLAPGASTFLRELPGIDAGTRDEITEAVCWAPAAEVHQLPAAKDPPEGLDWDAWVGPAPWSPYREGFVEGNWKADFEWGGGALRRDGVQLLTVILHTLGISELGDVRVSSGENGGVTWKLSGRDLTVRWQQPGPPGTGNYGIRLGDDGAPQSWDRAEAALDRSSLEPPLISMACNLWKRAIRERALLRDRLSFVAGATVMAHLGNLALRLGRPLEFDTNTMTFKNDAAADRWLNRPGRGAYHW